MKYHVPKYIADETNAAYAACHSQLFGPCAMLSNPKAHTTAAPSVPSAPIHGNLQSHLKTLVSEEASQDYSL